MARRGIVALIVTAMLIAAAIIGLVVVRGGQREDADDSLPSAATTPTTARPTTDPSTSATDAPTTSSSLVPEEQPIVGAIDLNEAVTRLEPHQIASFPVVPPGDLFPTAYAIVAPGNRIVLLDAVTGVVRFIDGTTRMDLTQYGSEVPTIGAESFIANGVFMGPGDVLYVDEGSASPDRVLVAYATATPTKKLPGSITAGAMASCCSDRPV